MRMPPRVSVVIPAYNYGRYLPTAVGSALGQGIEDLEVLVLDDCSTDGSEEAVAPFLADPRFRYRRNERNLGAVRNINRAFAEARGDFVLLLGADDFLLPGALASLLAALEKYPEAGFAYGTYLVVDEEGEATGTVLASGQIPADLPPWRDDFPFLLVHDHYMNLGATLFRRKVVQRYGAFDPVLTIDDAPGRFFRATDWDMCLRLALCGVRPAFVNAPLAAFRMHADQASANADFFREGIRLRETLQLLERYCCEANAPRLAGHEYGIYQHLQAKKAVYEQHADPARSGDRAQIAAAVARVESFLRDLAMRPFADPLSEAPTASVVVLARDNPHEVMPTLQSLAAQTWGKRQVLLVNRGRLNLGSLCRDERYLGLPGASAPEARNWGAQLTDGEMLCFVEAGTLLQPAHLENLAAGIAGGAVLAQAADESRDPPGVSSEMAAWQGALAALLPPGHPWRDRLPPLAAFAMRRHLFHRGGGFDKSLPVLDDLDFLLRLQRHFPIATLAGAPSVAAPSLLTAMLRGGAEHGDPEFALRHLKTVAERQFKP